MKYDRDVFADNIMRVMNQKGYKRKDIEEAIGAVQSRVSDCLNKKADFTLKQAVAVADFLGCSFDELLGREELGGTPAGNLDNMSDILNVLFSISDATPVLLQTYYNSGIDNVYGSDYVVMAFKNQKLNQVLREWERIQKFPSDGEVEHGNLEKFWQSQQLDKYKKYKIAWGMRDIDEFAVHLVNRIKNGKYEADSIYAVFEDDALKALERYISENDGEKGIKDIKMFRDKLKQLKRENDEKMK